MVPVNSTPSARRAALEALGLLDTPPEPAFDRLTALAARVCGTPFAAINLLTADRVSVRSRFGFNAPPPLAGSPCLAAAGGRAAHGVRRYRHKGGHLLDVSVSGSHLALDGRAVLCLVVRDIGEQ
jgi:hypothetical protein